MAVGGCSLGPGSPATTLWRSGSRAMRMTGRCDPVPDAGDGLDDLRVAEFAAEPADGDLDSFGERVGVFVPGLSQQVLGAESGGCSRHERLEHGELLGRNLDLAPVAGDYAVQGIELNPGHAQDAGPCRGLAAGQRP